MLMDLPKEFDSLHYHIDVRLLILGHLVNGLKQVEIASSNLLETPSTKVLFFVTF